METLKAIDYKGYKISIVADPDLDLENPRSWDNIGTFVYWHNRYVLGDKDGKDYGNPEDFLAEIAGIDLDNPRYENITLSELFAKAQKKNVILPVYLYDHSGLRLSTGNFKAFDPQGWDSGQVGFIYCTNEKARSEYGRVYRKMTEKYLHGEIETMDQFVSGEVYGYIVTDENDENIDSCYGFFGDDFNNNGLMGYAKPAIDHHIATLRKKRQEQVKVWIKNHVPLEIRAGATC